LLLSSPDFTAGQLAQAERTLAALQAARDTIAEAAVVHQRTMHDPHPLPCIDNCVSDLEGLMLGQKALVMRIKTVGR
jgi:hypothetical protein